MKDYPFILKEVNAFFLSLMLNTIGVIMFVWIIFFDCLYIHIFADLM